MRKTVRGALAALILGATGASVQAADLGAIKGPPPPPAFIDTFHPFQVRIRATAVVPDPGTSTIFDRNGLVLPLVGLSAGPGSSVPFASTTTSWAVVPEMDVSYYLTRNFAIEAICCVTRHHIQGIGTLAGSSLGRAWLFPPSLIFQYHFTNFGAFQPYVGVGVNFTAFFGVGAGNNLWPFFAPIGPGGAPVQVGFNTFNQATITPSWGVVGQIGFDYMITDQLGINLDLKRIVIEPNAHAVIVNTGAPGLGVPAGLTVPVNAKILIDPWVASIGVTYRFGAGFVNPIFAKF